jgi:long-chain acyl-CoA synthetase
VSPEEVEEILLSCPLIREVAVCGRPDPERGAAIVAHLVPSGEGSFALSDIVRHCQKEMPTYMQPLHFIVHEELPRTSSGKIDRRGLE